MAFDLESYVDVAERIRIFYEKYPDGRLTRLGEPKIMEVGGKLFVMYTARAYRTPDDLLPAIGTAWEPVPGPTQFTKDSELMNAETAAIGRAIVMVGIGTKRIASRQEVGGRNGEPPNPLPAATVQRLADLAKQLVESKVWDSKVLTTHLVAAGATNTNTVREALGTLTPESAAELEASMNALVKVPV